jgi:hypothetical protein
MIRSCESAGTTPTILDDPKPKTQNGVNGSKQEYSEERYDKNRTADGPYVFFHWDGYGEMPRLDRSTTKPRATLLT